MKHLLVVTFIAVGLAQISDGQTSRGEATRGTTQRAAAPGTYRDWHDIDEVTILQPFDASAYSQIAVESFDSSGVKLPETNDNTYRAGAIRVAGDQAGVHRRVGEEGTTKGGRGAIRSHTDRSSEVDHS